MLRKDPLQIIPFSTYGTSTHVYLKGRALEDEDIDLNDKNWWSLVVNSWKRFETDEIRETPLNITIGESNIVPCKTDKEGYYLLDKSIKNLALPIDNEGWFHYEVSFDTGTIKREIQQNNKFKGQMLIPSQNAVFGVISDIDDTILQTGVASPLKWRVAVNTFLKTPQKRKALEGSSEFYAALHLGKTLTEANPIFYVSNSPWNLYRYLDVFLTQNQFPKGPVLLRDFRTPFDKTPKTELAHKYHEIYNILKTYPHLNFILIGDCGEKDAYIYRDVVRQFPNRIEAIYLRAVEHSKKMNRIANLFSDYREVPVQIVEKSKEAFTHAKKHGFIP
ncbi:App1 family protein [uncultured Winogradskyella sp.]|uniref:App1 family protein n=1 Tax=uncultured Winogradskyella sp. TaxID=395353 RepID=UPI0035111C80